MRNSIKTSKNGIIINTDVDAMVKNLERNLERILEEKKDFERDQKMQERVSTETLYRRFDF